MTIEQKIKAQQGAMRERESAKNSPVRKSPERMRRVYDFDSDKDISDYFLAHLKGFQALFPAAKIEVIRGFKGDDFIALSQCSSAKAEMFGAGRSGYTFALRFSFPKGALPFVYGFGYMVDAYVRDAFYCEHHFKNGYIHPRGVILRSDSTIFSLEGYNPRKSFGETFEYDGLKSVTIYFHSLPYSKLNDQRID